MFTTRRTAKIALVATAVAGTVTMAAPGAQAATSDTTKDTDGCDAGILVQPGDARALADGITTLLESEETRTRFGRVGRRRAETTYSWRAVAEATAAVYTEEIARC